MCATLGRDLQRVVAGYLPGFNLTNLAKGRIGTIHSDRGRSIRSQLVRIDVANIVQVNAFGSNIGKFEDGREGNLLLYSRMPLLGVRGFGIWIHTKGGLALQ